RRPPYGVVEKGGEEDDRLLGVLGEDLLGRLEAGGTRHALVEDDHLGAVGPPLGNGGLAVGGLARDLGTLVGDLDRRPHQRPHVLFVVDDENPSPSHPASVPQVVSKGKGHASLGSTASRLILPDLGESVTDHSARPMTSMVSSRRMV